MLRTIFLISTIILSGVVSNTYCQQDVIYSTTAGNVAFVSDAPLELIKASSEKLKGAINITDNTFAFSLQIQSFSGFNSPLQKEHFNENYLESGEFPKATFLGKIIEDIDFDSKGSFEIRAKGILTIHGVEQVRIIRCLISIDENEIKAKSAFTILLSEHNISIPKIVYQKIAEEIMVSLEATLVKK